MEAIRAGLYALRAQADTLILVIEREMRMPAQTGCPHTETEDAPDSTFGHPRRRCVRCKAIVEG